MQSCEKALVTTPPRRGGARINVKDLQVRMTKWSDGPINSLALHSQPLELRRNTGTGSRERGPTPGSEKSLWYLKSLSTGADR